MLHVEMKMIPVGLISLRPEHRSEYMTRPGVNGAQKLRVDGH